MKFTVLWNFIKAMGVCSVLLSVASIVSFQALNVFGNFFLATWTRDDLLRNRSLSHTQEYRNRNLYYLSVYSLLGLLQGDVFVLRNNAISIRMKI